MVVRIPGPAEPVPFAEPTVAAGRSGTNDGLPDDTNDAMAHMQARDDAVFIATALAGLSTRQQAAAIQARNAAMELDADPDAQIRFIDGFTSRLDGTFDADVNHLIEGGRSMSGPRPSDAALDLFRRRAQEIRQGAIARNSVVEDQLRRAAQLNAVDTGIAGLEETVRAEPESLNDVLTRVRDLAGAAAALVGPEKAAVLEKESRKRVAASAVRGLIAVDAGVGLEALRAGIVDAHLDKDARSRLVHEAESMFQAQVSDRNRAQRQHTAAETQRREVRALAFLSEFQRKLKGGEADFSDIAAARADGTIGTGRADALSRQLEETEAARSNQIAQADGVGRTLQEGGRLDPANSGDRRAADLHYGVTVQPVLTSLAPGRRVDAIVDYVSATGIAPTAALRSLAGILVAAEPADRVRAAKAMTEMAASDASIGDALPVGVIKYARDLATLNSFDIPPEKAVEMVDRPSPKGTQVAFAPAAALLPALIGGADATAVGEAILGGLAAAGIISLSGDTPQEGTADDTGDGESRKGEKTAPDSGEPPPEPPRQPETPSPHSPPSLKPGGRGKKAEGSSKGERHGDDGRAKRKAAPRIEELRRKLENATSRREKKDILQRIKNISKDAVRKDRGEEHGRRGRRR